MCIVHVCSAGRRVRCKGCEGASDQAYLQRLRMAPVCWVDCLTVTGDASSSCNAASFQQARLKTCAQVRRRSLLLSLARCSGSQTRRARAVLLRCGSSLNSGDRGPSQRNGCTNPALGPHLHAPTKSAAAQVVPQQRMARAATPHNCMALGRLVLRLRSRIRGTLFVHVHDKSGGCLSRATAPRCMCPALGAAAAAMRRQQDHGGPRLKESTSRASVSQSPAHHYLRSAHDHGHFFHGQHAIRHSAVAADPARAATNIPLPRRRGPLIILLKNPEVVGCPLAGSRIHEACHTAATACQLSSRKG